LPSILEIDFRPNREAQARGKRELKRHDPHAIAARAAAA
jgi:hypothetical protein